MQRGILLVPIRTARVVYWCDWSFASLRLFVEAYISLFSSAFLLDDVADVEIDDDGGETRIRVWYHILYSILSIISASRSRVNFPRLRQRLSLVRFNSFPIGESGRSRGQIGS